MSEEHPAGACLRFLVAFFGLVASVLNATIGGSLFLLCAVTLTVLKRKGEVTRTLLPFFLGGKAFLALLNKMTADIP